MVVEEEGGREGEGQTVEEEGEHIEDHGKMDLEGKPGSLDFD